MLFYDSSLPETFEKVKSWEDGIQIVRRSHLNLSLTFQVFYCYLYIFCAVNTYTISQSLRIIQKQIRPFLSSELNLILSANPNQSLPLPNNTHTTSELNTSSRPRKRTAVSFHFIFITLLTNFLSFPFCLLFCLQRTY